MKVLFLNPPYFPMFSRESRSPCVTKSSTLYWPMYLAYAAGFTEQDGNEILLLDSPAMELDLEQTLAKIIEFSPDLAVLETSTPSILNDLEVVKEIKEKCNCPVAIVGTHSSAEPVESLEMQEALDISVIGESDAIVRELVRYMNFTNGDISDLSTINGIAWRNTKREIVRNPDADKIHDLDELPWVSKVYNEHLKSCYKKYFYGANLNPLIVILSGRGCPHRCTFCVIPQTLTGHVYRKRTPKDVVDELEYIVENFEELGEVFFEDDTFTADPRHTKDLCEDIISRNLKITWSANARADVPEDLLKLMKKAGCRELCVGFESASAKVLKSIKKGLREGSQEKFVRSAKNAGILIHGCFMVGNLNDTKETLEETLSMAKFLNPNTAQFYPIMAYPGTESYREARISGDLATSDYSQWLDKDGFHRTTITRGELSSQALVDFCDRARREFYLRPSYIFKQAIMSIKNPKERYRVFRGFGTLVKHLFRKHGQTDN